MIIKNCNNLTDFDFYLDYMSEENRNNFIEKFGSKLISLNLEDCEKPEVFLSSMKVFNIKKLVINRMSCAFNQLFFNKLNSFNIKEMNEKEIKPFEQFTESHRKSLRFLTVKIYRLKGKNSESFTQQLTKIVTKLDQLIHLSLISKTQYLLTNCCHFNDYLTQIALNCKQLKSFECSLQYDPDNQQLLTSLESLKYLERLKLDLSHYKCGEDDFSDTDYDLLYESSFKLFEGLQNITHLCLVLPDDCYVLSSVRRLQHIDIYLPNLQFFQINGVFKASEGLTQILSRLSKLETIRMQIIEPWYNRHSLTLSQNCPRLKNIDVQVLTKRSLYTSGCKR